MDSVRILEIRCYSPRRSGWKPDATHPRGVAEEIDKVKERRVLRCKKSR